jgi:hypothetical protein
MKPLGVVPGTSTTVAATAASVDESITCTDCDALYISNTSATLNVGVRWGVGAQTAVLATDLNIPPMGQVLVGINATVDTVAAIGSGAGPTNVVFTPVRRG